jgi:hypothetical protein
LGRFRCDLRAGFRRFVQGVPFYGLAVLCTDHPEVRRWPAGARPAGGDLWFIRRGDLRATNLRGFEAGKGALRYPVATGVEKVGKLKDCFLPMPGDHNVSNALAAVAVALHLGMSDDAIRAALAGFSGVGRRFTRVGEAGGVTVIDDYGHHPVEIAAALRAARQARGGQGAGDRGAPAASLSRGFVAVRRFLPPVSPMPMSSPSPRSMPRARTRSPAPAATIWWRDPRAGSPAAHALDGRGRAEALVIACSGAPGDMVICLGAGTISAWAQASPCGSGPDLEWRLSADSGDCHADRSRGGLGAGALAGRACGLVAGGRPGGDGRDPRARHPDPEPAAGRPDLAARRRPGRLAVPARRRGRSGRVPCRAAPDIPVFPMGVGSNLIVRDGGMRGVVIRLGRGFNAIEIDGDRVTAGAAALDAHVARKAAEAGLDLTFLRTIPGSIGGAVRMNAGCYGTYVADRLLRSAWSPATGGSRPARRRPEPALPPVRPARGLGDHRRDLSAPRGRPCGTEARMEDQTRQARRHPAHQGPQRRVHLSQPGRVFSSTGRADDTHELKAWKVIDDAGMRGARWAGRRCRKCMPTS